MLLAALYCGLAGGIEGARYLGLFVVWLTIVGSLVVFSRETRETLKAEGRSVPAPLGEIAVLAGVGLLVWHGYIVTAVFYLIASTLVYAGRDGKLPE